MSTFETVADQLVRDLVQMGVRRIYGLVGDSLNPISDAVRRAGPADRGGIDWVHVHNEEAAAFAAAAEAQLTGRLAVCAGSCGPGNTHLIQGVFDAHRSGAPVLVLASHITSTEIGTGFFQETHPERLFEQASHWSELASQPAEVPRLLRIAVQHAVGLRGAAVLVLPGDVTGERAEHSPPAATAPVGPSPATPPDEVIAELADRLDATDKVAIFAGIGCADARDEVLALAGALHAPMGHSLRGKESLQYDNPFDVGMSGLLGYGAAYDACNDADVLLLLGTDFPYRDFLPQARTIQVDRDPSRLGRRTPLELGVAGDVGATVRALLPHLRVRTDRRFLDDMLRLHARRVEDRVERYTHDVDRLLPIHPEYVARILDREAADDAVFTADTGMSVTWLARYISAGPRRRLLGSFVHGTMANALPHAIGAQSADRSRPVISLSGDGGLAMLLGELITVVQHDLPIKIVVFDNSSLGMVRLEMLVAGDPPFETDHAPVDYSAIARAVGMPAMRVEKPGDVPDAVRETLASPGPALLDVVTDPNALEVPPHITGKEARGFALAVGKIVLGGGVGDVVEMARANLRNIPV
jgi:pyruvate dehydrogenase (quinone)